MTKAEAIEWLIQIKDKYIYAGDEGFDAKRKEALDIAVEALKKGLKGEAFGETLIITVDDYSKVNRVIVKGEGHFCCVFEPIYDDDEQPTINQWIPCSERLPELHREDPAVNIEPQLNLMADYYMMSDPVLVMRNGPFTDKNERIMVAQYEDDLDGRVYWQTLDSESLPDVIAWIPLPAIWEEGESNG